MKHTAKYLSLFSVGALLLLSACSQESEAAAPKTSDQGSAASSSAAVEPVLSTLEKRATDRWQLIENEDWIQSYSFNSKIAKKARDLGSYLNGSSDNHYVVLSAPKLIGSDGTKGFVQVMVEWTPTHAELKNAANAGDGQYTDELDMVETWVWEGGEWFWENTSRTYEFVAAHPSLFRRDGNSAADSSESAALEGEELK